ncbi:MULTISPECIES: c-type cytochrome [Vibrio]|uniref:C-type cytochrome n=2 Tax=Vibrio TaxID=662 RepID=A0A7X4RT90_9VIBR|nr:MULTISPECIES: cytochrome c [Vibrio]MBF8999632.1 cytochrome c [Vibrio nitrifigilis]MZI92198.1 c-type cytochrome [Vibrio eleionomae]
MSTKKGKIIRIIVLLVVIVAIVAGWMLWKTFDLSRSDAADDTVKLSEFKTDDTAAIKRGEYIMRLGDCSACHTEGHGEMAGGYDIETPFGSLYSSNITPDPETGIGNMTERDFFNAVRQGIGSHGFLYPAMPYTAYVKFTDQDMHDLWAYFSTVKPVKNDIEETKDMPFPFNVRLSLAGWDMLFFDNTGFTEDKAKGDEYNRGKYLVDGGGHCSACHNPRNFIGAEIKSKYLQGGNLGTWYAPDLTPNPHNGISEMSVDGIAEYLKTGSNGIAVASGPMAEAVQHSTQYFTDSDLKAIGVYLKALPASEGGKTYPKLDVTKRAGLDYEVNCSACHGLEGEGITGMVPAFAKNKTIAAEDPTNLIHAMLKGTRAPFTHVRTTAAGMPSFAWKMNDKEIADVLNYVRNSWGNTAKEITPDQVAEMRKTVGARDKMATPLQK